MRRPLLILTIGAALSVGLAAQTSLDTFWHQPDGTNLQGTVLNCATGEGRRALPCGGLTSSMNTMQMPFNRSSNGDPIIFSGITTTAKQFEITKPADANAYRFVNPCNVDVRIRKVESLSENVTLTTDHIIILPTAPASLGAGYAVHHAFPTAANTLRVVLQAPALAVLGSYSIPVAVYAVNR